MMKVITQAAIEAAKAEIMAVKEEGNPVYAARSSSSNVQNSQSSTKTAEIQLEGSKIPRTMKLWDRGNKNIFMTKSYNTQDKEKN